MSASSFLEKNLQDGLSTYVEIENKDLLFISYDKEAPTSYHGLSFEIYLDPYGHVDFQKVDHVISDPSTIYVCLPICKSNDELPLSYYPNYIDLLPEQRYTYLNWLRNVDEPIDIGYVFLYYYGLERHLLVGDFEKAYNQIIRLRNVHKNKSFLKYSEAALIQSCIMKDRMDLLISLGGRTEISGFSNAQFLVAYNMDNDLSSQNLFDVFYRAIPLSKKAIKENRSLLDDCVNSVLISEYGKDSFDINRFDIDKIPSSQEIRFANYSFPLDIRQVQITDFYRSKGLMGEIEVIFKLAYENYKKKIAFNRSLLKGNKSEAEIRDASQKRDLNRYKKLLKEGKIKQSEYEILIKSIENNDLILSTQ